MSLKFTLYLLFILSIFLQNCSPESENFNQKLPTENPSKTNTKDPFSKTMVVSQFYELDGLKGGLVESNFGMVMAVPENAFLDENGNTFNGAVQIELAEANTVADLALSGLETLTDKGEPLESAGMFYFNASSNGKEVYLNPDSPIYVEMPSYGDTEGFKLYDGVRHEDGKIRWQNPKPMEKWLLSVDLDLLDFLPQDFEAEVQKGMPFRDYKIASKELVDSLYFSLKPTCKECGISPAAIKVLNSDKFNNTLISTREFAKRLQYIFKTCDQAVLDVYINNLDKNLWECDSMAAEILKKSPSHAEVFRGFAKEKLTKVKSDKNLDKLKNHYRKELLKTEKELDKIRKDYEKILEKKEEEALKVKEEYRKLLSKRLKYRMNKFGFVLTREGWKNVDKPRRSKLKVKMEPMDLNVSVANGNEFDRVHVYTVDERIKSIFALTSRDGIYYNRVMDVDSILLFRPNQLAVALVVAYKGEQPYFAYEYFRATNKVHLSLSPSLTDPEKLKDQINQFNRFYNRENRIMLDLDFQKKIYDEKLRKEKLAREKAFMFELSLKAFPCECEGEKFAIGKNLFQENCQTCHDVNRILVGPAMKGISKRRDFEWIVDFVHNSQKVIKRGDTEAVKLYEKFNKTEMPNFTQLSRNDIWEIVRYVDCLETEHDPLQFFE